MSSFKEYQSPTENVASDKPVEVFNTFKRKYVSDWRFIWPRRYVLAFVLCVAALIQAWRSLNIAYTLAHVIILGNEEAKVKYPSIGHWTMTELDNYKTSSLVVSIFAQMPGAFFIFTFSSHKYLLLSVFISSILHLLIPVALNHHSDTLLLLLMSECIIEAPTNIAVITIWRDWSPPGERTKLVLFSLLGVFLGAAGTSIYPLLFPYLTTNASFYLAGISGMIWALFWFNMISDTPQNDPLISERELRYIENNLPSDHLQTVKLKDIPWKSILSSKPILVLCVIFFKMACSMEIIMISGAVFSIHLASNYNPLFFSIPFVSGFALSIIISAILADFLIKYFNGKALLIRRNFTCGGFFLQCVLLFGTLAESELTKNIMYMISYSVFAVSLSGFITLPLDLSPRYVAIVAGIVFTFYTTGYISIIYFIEGIISLFQLHSLLWIFLFDGCITMLSMLLFSLWGDVEEQLWSLTFPTSLTANDYRSYPKPEDEDELNLVP